MEGETRSGKPLAEFSMAEGIERVTMLVMDRETTSGKPLAESVMAEGLEEAAVLVMEGETTSGKPLAEFIMAKGMEGWWRLWRGKPHQVNHWQNLLWRRA